MSDMIPESLVNVLRSYNNISVDIYGIECTLYTPSNWEIVDEDDVYAEPQDYTYDSYETKVFVEWNPNKHRLIKYGIFVEDEIPIIAYFSNKIKDGSGFKHYKSIPQNSYVRIPMQFIPNTFNSDEFEIVDVVISNMHDASIRKFYKLVPRRVRGGQ